MPPKGSKGRLKRTGSASTSGENGEAPDTIPTVPDSPGTGATLPASPSNPDDMDSDTSELNEDDSFKILKKILLNQKIAEKKSDERFAKLNKSIKDSKKSLENYKDINDKAVASITTKVDTTVKNLKDLQDNVADLKTTLDQTTSKLDDTQKLLDDTRMELKAKDKTLEKLEKKYERDEEELKRCLLLLDGVNERDNKRPVAVIEKLLSDLEINFKDCDIKSTYRIGPLKTGISRPRTIKVHFTSPSMKGEIFKNIGKLRKVVTWKGVHLSDALSNKELREVKDLRCIYAAGKAQGLDIKMKGNVLVIDGIRLSYRDIDHLPYGLTMESVKLWKLKTDLLFNHTMRS